MKTNRFFCALALSAIALVSCQEELQNDIVTDKNNDTEIVAEAGQIVCHAPATETKTAVGTKDGDGAYPVYWINGDAIKVYSSAATSGVEYTTSFENDETGEASAAFSPVGSGLANDVARYAVYPASVGGEYADGKISINLRGLRSRSYHGSIEGYAKWTNYTTDGSVDLEKYRIDSAFPNLPLFASAAAGEDNFNFKNLFGALRVYINDYQGNDIRVKSIKIISDEYISGTMQVAEDGTFELVSNAAGDVDKAIEVFGNSTLEDPYSTTKLSDATPALGDKGKAFIFFIPAKTYSSGFTFQITDTEGRIYTKTTTNSVTVEPGVLKSWPTLNLTLYYGNANCVLLKATNVETSIDATPYYTFNPRLVYDGTPVEYEEGVEAPELTAEVAWGLVRNGTSINNTGTLASFSLEGNTLKVKPKANGNTLVSIKNGKKIVWSFHIWVSTNGIADVTYVIGSDSFQMMNANLGASYPKVTASGSASNTYGMFYQWGRKEPLPAFGKEGTISNGVTALFDSATNDASTIVSAIQNPLSAVRLAKSNTTTTFLRNGTSNDILWGSAESKKTNSKESVCIKEENTVKTVYDPCPEGYMVPQPYHFSGLVVSETTPERTAPYSVVLNYDGTNETHYPLSGVFLSSGNDIVSGESKSTTHGALARYHTSTAYGTGGWASCIFDIRWNKTETEESESVKLWPQGNRYFSKADCYNVRCMKITPSAQTASVKSLTVTEW